MENTTGTPDQIDPPDRGKPLEVGGEDPATRSKKDSRREDERKQDQRQNGGRDDAGDDEDLASTDHGRGVESAE
jgi:hypothetical protein